MDWRHYSGIVISRNRNGGCQEQQAQGVKLSDGTPHDEGRGDACHRPALIVRRAMRTKDRAMASIAPTSQYISPSYSGGNSE